MRTVGRGNGYNFGGSGAHGDDIGRRSDFYSPFIRRGNSRAQINNANGRLLSANTMAYNAT